MDELQPLFPNSEAPKAAEVQAISETGVSIILSFPNFYLDRSLKSQHTKDLHNPCPITKTSRIIFKANANPSLIASPYVIFVILIVFYPQ